MHQINLLPCDIYFISHLYELRSEQRYSIELGESNPLQLWEQKFHDTDLNEEKDLLWPQDHSDLWPWNGTRTRTIFKG